MFWLYFGAFLVALVVAAVFAFVMSALASGVLYALRKGLREPRIEPTPPADVPSESDMLREAAAPPDLPRTELEQRYEAIAEQMLQQMLDHARAAAVPLVVGEVRDNLPERVMTQMPGRGLVEVSRDEYLAMLDARDCIGKYTPTARDKRIVDIIERYGCTRGVFVTGDERMGHNSASLLREEIGQG
jgi:hypothetical protein